MSLLKDIKFRLKINGDKDRKVRDLGKAQMTELNARKALMHVGILAREIQITLDKFEKAQGTSNGHA